MYLHKKVAKAVIFYKQNIKKKSEIYNIDSCKY